MSRSKIDIIPSCRIDAKKWDICIRNSEANKIYAKYIYLNCLADNWSGLVVNDYRAVMPIVWRSKWNIRYIYDAPFIQQLGLFGTYSLGDLQQAVDNVMKFIRYGDLYFNHNNKAVLQLLANIETATNLILPLQDGYEQISKGYNNHLQTKLRKAAAQLLQYTSSNNVELAVNTYKQLYAQRFPSVKKENYQKLLAVARQLYNQEQCFVREVRNKENKILAIALFMIDENRIYNILPSTTEEGRKLQAMHFLIDNVLKEFSGKQLIFDFEGSDVPGIKAFYQSFGAVNEPYYHLHYNHLPIPFKWLKR